MTNFSDIELPEFLQAALHKINFVEPTEIQRKTIPSILSGKDIIACSETGSGKTAAYLIPMVKELLESPKSQGLILAPTRELAQQISEFLSDIAPNPREFHTTRLVGGQDIRKQFKSLQKKPRIIVATPGRLIDHLKRNTVQLNTANLLVLDEGDRMIDMGFAPQLQQILKYLPEKRQTSFFTATLDDKVQKLANKYLYKPVKVMINNSRPVSTINQSVVQVEIKDKDECILNELNERKGSVIIFLKTKHRTDRLKKYLDGYGFDVDLIHGGRTQGQRNKAIKGFKNKKSRILCATDVAARGIDVPHVEHVINFDIPMQDEDYVHRIGRTARNGAEGEAITLVTPQEHRDWNRLVKKYDIQDALLEETKGSMAKNSRARKPRGKSAKSDGFSRGKKKTKSAGGRWSKKSDSSDERRGKKKTKSSDERWDKKTKSSDERRGKKKTKSSDERWDKKTKSSDERRGKKKTKSAGKRNSKKVSGSRSKSVKPTSKKAGFKKKRGNAKKRSSY